MSLMPPKIKTLAGTLLCFCITEEARDICLGSTTMIFVLMAGRRLESDPFLNERFTGANYSSTGLRWIESTDSLRTILLRHYPVLKQDLPQKTSVFVPLKETQATRPTQ